MYSTAQHIPNFHLKLSSSSLLRLRREVKPSPVGPHRLVTFHWRQRCRGLLWPRKAIFAAPVLPYSQQRRPSYETSQTREDNTPKHMRPFPNRGVTPTRLNLLSCGHFLWWHSKHSNQIGCPPGVLRHFTPSYSCNHTQPGTKGKPTQHPERLVTSAWPKNLHTEL